MENVKRVARPPRDADDASTGWTTAAPSGRSGSPRFLEMKTVWHPIGV